MAAAVLAGLLITQTVGWSLSRELLPPQGGPLVIEGASPPGAPLPELVLISPSGHRQPLRVYKAAETPEGSEWQASVVLDRNLSSSPQTWTVSSQGASAKAVVAPTGASGFGGGVLATYRVGGRDSAPLVSKLEPIPHLGGSDSLPGSLRRADFSTRWEGFLTFPRAGKWSLRIETKRAVRLVLGAQRPSALKDATHEAQEGERLPFALEGGPGGADWPLSWQWRWGDEPWSLIPRSQFDPPGQTLAPVSLEIQGSRDPVTLNGSGLSLTPLCQAQSPYGGVEAWAEVKGEGGWRASAPIGTPIPLPGSIKDYQQTFEVTFFATDTAGQTREVQGPPVTILPLPRPQKAVPIPFDDREEPRSLNSVPTGDKEQLVEAARKAAERWGIDPDIFCRMIAAESSWNPEAVSPVGAMGLGQLMPGTAEMLGVSDPFDPHQNLDGAARYLAAQFRRFGTYRLALAAYNAGPGAVSRHRGVPPYAETQRYVRKILGS
jgi:hypothetical protein